MFLVWSRVFGWKCSHLVSETQIVFMQKSILLVEHKCVSASGSFEFWSKEQGSNAVLKLKPKIYAKMKFDYQCVLAKSLLPELD